MGNLDGDIFRKLWDISDDGIALTDENGILLYVNLKYCEIYRITEKEIIGKNFTLVFPAEHREQLMRQYLEVFRGKREPENYEVETRNARGEIQIIKVRVKLLTAKDEKPVLFSVIKDITDHKRTEEKYLRSEQKYRDIFENIHDTYYEVDTDGFITDISPSIEILSKGQYTREELVGKHMKQLYANLDDRDRFLKKIQQEGRVNDYEVELLNKDGSVFVCSISSHLRLDEDGKPLKIIGSIRDITDRKKAEEKVTQAEKKFRSLIENAPDGVTIIDSEGIMLYVSPNAFRQFGYKKSDIIGHSGAEFTHPDDIAVVMPVLEKILTNPSESQTVRYRFRRKSGEYRWIETTFTNLLRDDAIQGIVLNFSDITEKKKVEEELIHAKEKAEESDRLKSAFLANISHEIRTPLNGLLGFLDFLGGDIDLLSTDERKNYIDIMRKSGDRLVNTVTDIVEASKLDSGVVEISKEKFDLQKALDGIINEFKNKYSDSQIEIIQKIDPQIKEQYIYTDKSKLLRVLRSLLDNAFKFTSKGTVLFEVKKTNDDLRFLVKDSGIGMTPDNIKIIFDPFRQVDDNLNRTFEGNGLGLTIAYKLVKFLGGELTAESEQGKGSIFYFSLPHILNEKEIQKADDIVPTVTKNITGKKILVAEDDAINYLFLQAVLEKQGCRLIHANNGREAVELFKNNKVDLVIMDLKMPVMNGIDATFKIKEIDNSVPIIAHSAYVLNNEKEQSLAAGCADYLPKPVKTDELIKTVSKHLNYRN